MLALFLLLPLADKAELIQGTAGSRSDALSLQAGGVVLREGGPGAAFGTIQAGKAKRQLAYYLVVRHRYPGEGKTESNEDVTAEGLTGTARHTLTVNGNSLVVSYSIKLGEGTKKPKEEKLSLGGKAVDLTRGRVFLVDMTVSPPRVEQRKLDLPAEVGDLSARKAAGELERRVTASLIKQAREVKTFLSAKPTP
jgi:hypothetical protein